uniref:Ribonuclease E n=1 Tax=Melanthalia intermedia TaxID=172989 RepID=A0A345UAG3_9FLOR|nr:ribonuclease E [Melanthalia intermedia]AXI97449.1 ribonuclease E [Melanthalia intermedia]
MVKKIVISHYNNLAAILQNNKIQEIITINNFYQVNDVYLGIVQKIFSSINAAFVKLNKEGKSGFIHFNDIKTLKKGRRVRCIREILSINQLILVQVTKEASTHKGPRLTTNIHLQGRYLTLMPFCNTICISRSIYDRNERTYLYSLGILLKPGRMGLLIKSAAKGIKDNIIVNDLNNLKKQWNFIEKAVTKTAHPLLVYKDEDLIKKIIRDFYEENIGKIIIDSKEGLSQLQYFLNKWSCVSSNTETMLQLYAQTECILDQFHVKQAIQNALQPKVKLPYGGHIIIENNEALTVIDVNSGSFNKSNNSREAILKTNFYAAIEIAYQLKIRNINGVIVIDFIDMFLQSDQLKLLEHFSRLLKLDNAKPRIVQLTELGLVELTRRRREQSLEELFIADKNLHIHTQTHKSRYLKSLNKKHKNYKSQEKLYAYKNIQSLLFSKKFRKRIALRKKYFEPSKAIDKQFIHIDSTNPVQLFNPRANHIAPLEVYSELIDRLISR